jgi:hypothetical protein
MTYWPYESCTTCSGKPQPGTVALLKYLLVRFPQTRSMGIYNCRNVAGTTSKSIHSCGRAIDLGIPTLSNGRANTAIGHPVVRFLGTYAEVLGIHGQIYDRVRYDRRSPAGRYYSGSHPHYDHDHIEQTLAKAKSLTYADIVALAGDPIGDDDMLIKNGDAKSANAAEAQKMMAERFKVDNGTWSPFPGVSIFDGQPFKAGQDGAPGSTFEKNVKIVQKTLGQPETGVLDQRMWDALVHHRYGGGGTVDLSKLATKADLANHAKAKASSTVHPHGHGGPQ